MAKYIGTYASSGDVQTALDNLELSRPFIAYTTDNDKVYFGSAADRAEVGDIVVYSVADDLLHYIKQADYSASTYPVADYVPVGVVAYPQNDDAILGPTGEITFVALKYLSKTSPDFGASTPQGIEWGYDNYDIPELTNYETSGTAITDMDGKANTQAVLQYATAQTDWRTASAITFTNASGYYPGFECAWRYHTSGTVQGDWYIPAAGQVNKIAWPNSTELSVLNSGLRLVGAPEYSTGAPWQYSEITSTELGRSNAWNWRNTDFGTDLEKSNDWMRIRPFCNKLMTRI